MFRTINYLFVTCFGIGSFRFAPGTITSLVTTIFLYSLFHIVDLSSSIIILILFLVFIYSFYAVSEYLSYIENKDTQYGIVDDSSKLAYILHHNIKKYEGIRIIENNLAKTLYAFIVPKGSDYLDRINSALRDAQKEKINQKF